MFKHNEILRSVCSAPNQRASGELSVCSGIRQKGEDDTF